MSRGLSLNNPFDLEVSEHWTWLGEVRPTSDPEGLFCQFQSLAAGLRAGIKNLRNQQIIHRLRTVETIIEKYAPPSENNTDAYVAAVCAALDVDPEQTIDLSNPITLATFAKAVIIQEQGSNPFTDDEIQQAVASILPAQPLV